MPNRGERLVPFANFMLSPDGCFQQPIAGCDAENRPARLPASIMGQHDRPAASASIIGQQ
jgi:hypothetical protein